MGHMEHHTASDRGAEGAAAFDVRRRAVQAWRRQLPVASPTETGRQLYEALSDVNRQSITPRQRLAFLTQLDPVLADTVAGLRAGYEHSQLPLRGAARKHLDLVRALLEAMAAGYEAVLSEDVATRRPRQRRLCHALVAALRYRSSVVVEHWVIYETAPTGAWQRLHALYQMALDAGLGDRRGPRPWQRYTPAGVYKHVAVMAVTNPLQFDRGPMRELWWFLDQTAEAAQISDRRVPGDEAFHLPRRGDVPPHLGFPDRASDDDRCLNITPLIQRIQVDRGIRRRGLSRFKGQPVAVRYPALAEQAVLALQRLVPRRDDRVPAASRVEGVLGLSKVYRALCREMGRDEAAPEANERSRGQIDASHWRDVSDGTYPQARVGEIETRLGQAPFLANQQTELNGPGAPDEHWQLVDISSGGYCLLTEADRSWRARVGDPIILRDAEDPTQPWQFGRVRWLRAMAGDQLWLGVEVIATDPRPVMVRPRFSGGQRGSWEPGAILPGRPPTVVIPADQYRPDQPLAVCYGSMAGDIVVSACCRATNYFAQCEFEYADAEAPAAIGGGASASALVGA